MSEVPLSRFEGPIELALKAYQESSGGLFFDLGKASKLLPTPEKPNYARSTTNVLFGKEYIGNLYVIAFKPKDGTGSKEFYNLDDLTVDSQYPREIKVVPRDKAKAGVHSEIHLTIATHDQNVHAEPKLYAGKLDLLGLVNKRVTKIGQLGHPINPTIEGVFGPMVTFTVGYNADKRFGDPHAVYNPSLALQVCAFLAISDEVQKKHPDILEGLNPRLPLKG